MAHRPVLLRWLRLSPLLPALPALPALIGCGEASRATADARDARDAPAYVPETAAGALAPSAPVPPALVPAPISLDRLAGRWQMRAVPEAGDTTPTTYVLTATDDTSGWSIAFPDGPPVPLRIVAVDGDSIVAETGEYRSVRWRGASVRTRSVVRLDGDQLVGTSIARYRAAGVDSVLRLHTDGTRRP